MKKITLLLTILAFVLAFGSAYGMEMTDGRTNGITVFSPVSAAGGVTNAKLELNNGITIFAAGPIDFESVPTWGTAAELSEGSAAGGVSAEGSHMKLYNGITIFD